MNVVRKIWAAVKSYWYVPFMLLIAVVAGLKKGRIQEIMNIADESRKRQNDAIDAAAHEKKIKKQKIQQEYEDALQAVDRIHQLQKKKLDKSKKEKVKKITKMYYNDKEKISQEISNEFGFQYTPRKDNSNN